MTIFLRDVLTDACRKGGTPGKEAENEASFRITRVTRVTQAIGRKTMRFGMTRQRCFELVKEDQQLNFGPS